MFSVCRSPLAKPAHLRCPLILDVLSGQDIPELRITSLNTQETVSGMDVHDCHSMTDDEFEDGETVSAVRRTPSPLQVAGQNSLSRSSPGLICVVCGDTSSGKHYGILACNGCSGFFKRSVRRKLIYRCQAGNGTCAIDKAHRNQCQACRLKKCMQMGMNKDAVQNERQPRNSATVRYDMVEDRNVLEGTVAAAFYPVTGVSASISTAGSAFRSTNPRFNSENIPSFGHHNAESLFQQSLNPDKAGSLLSIPAPPISFVSNGFENVLCDTAARLLYASVKWAKSLPSFVTLPFRDQITLLEESWCELFLMWSMQWSFPLDTCQQLLVSSEKFSGGSNISASKTTEIRLLTDVFSRFRALAVDPAEFACLKAIVLFRPDAKGLKELSQIENLQDQAQIMLGQHVRIHYHTQPARFGRLLLLLQYLHQIPSDKIELCLFSRLTAGNSMGKVLSDIYKG